MRYFDAPPISIQLPRASEMAFDLGPVEMGSAQRIANDPEGCAIDPLALYPLLAERIQVFH